MAALLLPMSRVSARALPVAVIAAVVAAAACCASLGTSGSAIRFSANDTTTKTDTSTNWAGYALTGLGSTVTTASAGTTFSDVTATWVQPAAACTPGSSASSAMWVGLGGYSESSQELEQTGTDSDCSASGTPSYYAWYELVPANSVNVKLKVSAGDTITAVVQIKGTDVLVQLHDHTRGTRFTKHLTMAQPDLTSAEVIAEAPSECSSVSCHELALTNFGSVTFSNVAALAATSAGGVQQGGHIVSPLWQATPIQLIPEARRSFGGFQDPTFAASTAGAIPASLTAAGDSFIVNWVANATGGSASTTPTTTSLSPDAS